MVAIVFSCCKAACVTGTAAAEAVGPMIVYHDCHSCSLGAPQHCLHCYTCQALQHVALSQADHHVLRCVEPGHRQAHV